MHKYNATIKDFGNGLKQVKLYDFDITILDDDFEKMARIEKIWENKSPDIRTYEEKEIDSFYKRLENNNRAKNNVYDIARSNKWDWFLTLTFSPEKVNRYDYSECLKKLQKRFSKIREQYYPDMKYLLVPELHKDGGVHFHGLLANCDLIHFTPAINPHTQLQIVQKGLLVFNWNLYTLGFCTATPVKDTKCVSHYITKYITKSQIDLMKGKRRFLQVKIAKSP